MPKYYAWSNFPISTVTDSGRAKAATITVGSEVKASDLDISDDEFQVLIDTGSVREQPYPKAVAELTYGDSPNRYYRDQLVKAADGDLTAEDFKELRAAGLTGDEETAGLGDAAEGTEGDMLEEVNLGGIKV